MRTTGSKEPGITSMEDPRALRIQERIWRFQRVGWVATLLLVLASVAGLLAPGLLLQSPAVSDDGDLVVDYARVAHDGGTADLEIAYEAASAEPVVFTLTEAFAGSLSISQITPEPTSFRGGDGAIELEFEPRQAGPLEIQIEASGDDIGLVRGSLTGPDGEQVDLVRFYWP